MTFSTTIRSLAREPLTHFFALGLLLFAVFDIVDREDRAGADEIVVDGGRVSALIEGFRRTWQRPPTEAELRGLLDNWVREEILYREGLAMQLDRGDPVVRSRIAQKVAFVTDGLMTSTPADADLKLWLDEHPDDYRIAARYSLRQVYFDPSRHGEALPAAVTGAQESLARGDIADVGDATLLPARLDDVDEDGISRIFGAEFAAAIGGLPTAQWAGPVTSGYGLHLVYVESREPARMPTLDEARAAVERDLMRARTEAANAAFYDALREKYAVTYTNEALGLVPEDGS